MKGSQTMSHDKVSAQDISLELGIDHRLITEWFRRAKTTVLAGDNDIEIEHFGIFHKSDQREVRRFWQWQITRLLPRSRVGLRSLRRDQQSKRRVNMPGGSVQFVVFDSEVSTQWTLAWNDGLLLERVDVPGFTFYREDSPMQLQRMGRGQNGPRILGQFEHATGKVKVELVLEETNWHFRRTTQVQPHNHWQRIMITGGVGIDSATGTGVNWKRSTRPITDHAKYEQDFGEYDDMGLISMLKWMCLARSGDENTGPQWEDDIV